MTDQAAQVTARGTEQLTERPIERSCDVAVIGAGVSGLRAAQKLQGSGVSVRVFEARDRVGGRVLSPRRGTGDRAIDLGATWFWPNEQRVIELVAEAGLSIFPQHMAGDMLFQNGPDQPGPVQRLSGNQLDVPSSRLVDGMASIAIALENSLVPNTVELGQVVSAVIPDGDGVVVHTQTQRVVASHVVIALPPALAVARIDFGGALGEHVSTVAAATPVWMGTTIKVVAVFEQAFWRSRGLAGAAFSYAGPMREIHDMSGPDGEPAALFGFCSTPPSDDAPTTDAVIAQFVELFGDEASHPTSVDIMDWRHEPHTTPPEALAANSYQTYGHTAYQTPAMDGRLHWAGTETSVEAPGHVEGALAAADRAVTAITSLAPPTEPEKEDQ